MKNYYKNFLIILQKTELSYSQKIFKSLSENLQIFREKSPILIATTIYLPLPKYNNLSLIRRRCFGGDGSSVILGGFYVPSLK